MFSSPKLVNTSLKIDYKHMQVIVCAEFLRFQSDVNACVRVWMQLSWDKSVNADFLGVKLYE
ncbi:hypothetical protein EGR_11065 [Echinococcus granulosus]|uniref:Uncharacterized protein n=1 Tax=Echinococcus granulosus TaxID=6210 RepID=W6U6U4_ECHGR|nr:hypothetical protein EGR_11065 [Echinococcus granulosus]EUB54077.1 hypothetical protein EGR_11065 [Echinococcus granulosus]